MITWHQHDDGGGPINNNRFVDFLLLFCLSSVVKTYTHTHTLYITSFTLIIFVPTENWWHKIETNEIFRLFTTCSIFNTQNKKWRNRKGKNRIINSSRSFWLIHMSRCLVTQSLRLLPLLFLLLLLFMYKFLLFFTLVQQFAQRAA